MHTVRGDTGAEAAFHFLSQALSVATQNSSPAVIVSVDIHEFNLNVSEIFLSKQRWGCGAGYLSASIKVCPICLFSSKLLLSSQTYRWHNCMWFFISVPLLNECFTAGGVTHSFQVRKWFFLWSVEVTVLFGGHWIPFLYVCVFFFYLKPKSVSSLMQRPWVSLLLYLCTASTSRPFMWLFSSFILHWWSSSLKVLLRQWAPGLHFLKILRWQCHALLFKKIPHHAFQLYCFTMK